MYIKVTKAQFAADLVRPLVSSITRRGAMALFDHLTRQEEREAANYPDEDRPGQEFNPDGLRKQYAEFISIEDAAARLGCEQRDKMRWVYDNYAPDVIDIPDTERVIIKCSPSLI